MGLKPVGRSDLGSDVNLLKVGQAQLERDVTGLRDDIRNLATTLDKMIDRQQPKWQVYASMGALMIAIVGAFGLPYLTQLDELRGIVRDHTTGEGHPSSTARLTSISSAIANLDQKTDTRFNDLEMRVQREMRDLNQTLRAETKMLYWRSRAEHLSGLAPLHDDERN